MSTWPASKKCSYCQETGRPLHCGMCAARNTIDDLERQLAEACKLVISAQTERDEAQGKLDAVEGWAQEYADGKKASPVLVLGMRVAARAILRILKEENDG